MESIKAIHKNRWVTYHFSSHNHIDAFSLSKAFNKSEPTLQSYYIYDTREDQSNVSFYFLTTYYEYKENLQAKLENIIKDKLSSIDHTYTIDEYGLPSIFRANQVVAKKIYPQLNSIIQSSFDTPPEEDEKLSTSILLILGILSTFGIKEKQMNTFLEEVFNFLLKSIQPAQCLLYVF